MFHDDQERRTSILELDSLYQFEGDGGDANTNVNFRENTPASVGPEGLGREDMDDIDRDSMAEVLLSSPSEGEHQNYTN